MVTQANSGKLRTAIGQTRRRLDEKVQEEVSSREDITSFTSSELTDVLIDISDIIDQIDTQSRKLRLLEQQWDSLIQADVKEKTIKDQYISKYGEWQSLLKQGEERIKALKVNFVFARQRLSTLDADLLDTIPEVDAIVEDFLPPVDKNRSNSITTMDVKVAINADAPDPNAIRVGPKPGQVIPVPTGFHQQPTSGFGSSVRIALPQMTMPTFQGDISKYHEFRDTFLSTMNYLQVDDLSKLHYLKTSISGEAADLLRSLPVNHQNFAIAMATLDEEYGGNVRIQNTLLLKLRNLPDLTSNTDPAALRHFGLQANLIFDQLKSMGCQVDNISTANMIESKLPKRIITKLYSNGTQGYPSSAKQLIQKIKEIARIENLVADLHKKSEDHRHATTMATVHHQQQKRNNIGNRTNGHTGTHRVTSPCAFCVEERMMHHPHLCRRYDSTAERKQRATELRLCYRCLLTGHSARQCAKTCRNCNGNHHQAICPRNRNGNPRNDSSNGNNHNSMRLSSQPDNQQAVHAQHNQQMVNTLTRTSNGNSNGSSSGNFSGNSNGSQGYQRKNQSNRKFYNNRQQTHVATAAEGEPDNTINAVTHSTILIGNLEEKMDNCEAATLETTVNINETTDESSEHDSSSDTRHPPVIMMTAELPIMDKDGNEHIGTVFFDSGSNMSYISKSFSDKLQLTPTGTRKLNVSTFGSNESKSLISKIFNVNIKNRKSTNEVTLCEVEHIASNIVTVTVDPTMVQHLLQDEPVKLSRQRKEVDILIGLDSYLQLLGQVNTLRLINGLQLNLTDCGPIISGKEIPVMHFKDNTFTTTSTDENTDRLCQQLNKFWSLESIGITDSNPTAKVDEEVNTFFRKTTTRTPDGRFVVRLPYNSHNKIPSNRALAYGRLQSAIRRLMKEPTLMKKYSDIFKEQLELDFIELVVDESKADGPVTFYLPHHPVIKETSKTTKVRIVFDGSSKAKKIYQSLNEILHTGERLLPDIAGIFLRIRQCNILISADIEKAFLQLLLHIADRDATRFLWIDPETLEERCYRYKRVPFGLKSSPFLLNRSVRTLLESSSNPMAHQMINSFYVDNAFLGTDTIAGAKEFYHFAKSLFKEAQMNLCQWFSNSPEFNNYIAELQNTPIEPPLQKLLGISWDTTTDELIFTLPKFQAELLTKRIMLKMIASCYDPSGILTPVTLIGKLFFQTIAHKGQSWDAPLSTEQHEEVKKIIHNWNGNEWRVPRKFFSGNLLLDAKQLELHIFTDASKVAYGTVAYVRVVTQNHAAAQFIMAKSRVVPTKSNYSIPQLEVLALLTGVRLANYCLKELQLQIKQTYVWTDSMCTIDSLQTTSPAGTRFVRNRVKQIQEQGEDFIFTHVPGKINPADLLTRGISFDDLKKSNIWLSGPEFLHSNDPLPVRRHSTELSTIFQETNLAINRNTEDVSPINVEYFSSFHRLLRMVMIMVHFITRGKFSLKERIARAKRLLFRLAQMSNPPSDQTIESLQLEKDSFQDLWLYYGRMIRKPLIYLPHGRITKLLILNVHIQNHHSSPIFTLSKLREHYWIPRGLSYTKKTLGECNGCKRLRIHPYHHPSFAPFPDERTLPSQPFQHAAVDYAGPLMVTINSVVSKVWILLFTCLYSRFVATELVTDMSTSTFLHALRRLSSLYGTPETITCDNAKQFHLLEEVIKSVKDQMKTAATLTSVNLPQFRFITPHSPWSGGVYERMIGLIKNSLLKAGATTRMFEIEEFRTTLAECTQIINCRPLTYISSDDDIAPLRPIDFIQPHGRHSSDSLLALNSNLDFADQPWNKRKLAEEWEQLSSVTEDFRRRWSRDYIQVLQSRKDFEHQQKHSTSERPQVGDIVLISQPSTKTTTWPLGKIEVVKERSAIVKNGKTKRLVEYPWKLLYPLETHIGRNQPEKIKDSTSAEDETSRKQTVSQQVPATVTERETTANPRRSTRRKMQTQFYTGLVLLSFFSITSAHETTAYTFEKTSPSTINRDNYCWILQQSWTWLLFILLLMYGLHGCITAILFLNCIIRTCVNLGTRITTTTSRIGAYFWNSETSTHKQSAILIVFVCIVQSTFGCNEIASLQAKDDVCVQTSNSQQCFLNKVVTLNLRPDGQLGCYKIRSETSETFLEVEAIAIRSTCNEKTHHFSRQYKINHLYTHRCYEAGSCIGNKCSTIKENEGIPEFTAESMDGFGYTRCYSTCGCVSCSGCVSCFPSCIFSRLYAEPTSFASYEIVQCPTWTTSLEIKVTMDKNTTNLIIPHGIPIKLQENILLVVTGFSSSPAPVHSATFIKRKTSSGTIEEVGYTLAPPSSVGRPTKGSVGELQCPSEDDANNFNCIWTRDVCDCTVQATDLTCSCQVIDLDEVIQKNSLNEKNIAEGNIELSYTEDRIVSRTTSSGIISFQLQLKNYTVTRLVQDDTCEVSKVAVVGCHSCQSGGNITLNCKSSFFSSIRASIECQSLSSFVECTNSGQENNVSLFHNKKDFVDHCSVSCGRHSSSFLVNGTLSEEQPFQLSWKQFIPFNQKVVTLDTLWDAVTQFVNNAYEWISSMVVGFIGHWILWIVVGVLILWFALRLVFARECRIRSTRNRYIRLRNRLY